MFHALRGAQLFTDSHILEGDGTIRGAPLAAVHARGVGAQQACEGGVLGYL